MKPKFEFLVLSLLMFLFLACSENTTPSPNPIPNPCALLSVKFTKGPSNFSTPFIGFWDGKEADTVEIDYVGFGNEFKDLYKVLTFDADGLKIASDSYETDSGNLFGSEEIVWWSENIRKEWKVYDSYGNLSSHSNFDDKENRLFHKFYIFNNIKVDISYSHEYDPNDLLLETIEYDQLKNDTSSIKNYSYDNQGRLIRMETRFKSVAKTDYITQYSYDAQDRLIEETYSNLTDMSISGKKISEYLNGGKQLKQTIFDADNEIIRYGIINKDEYGNILSVLDYLGMGGDLNYTAEYAYQCAD